MAKVRVYELAKELSMDNKELVEKLKAAGILVKNYMSTLDEQVVEKAREGALGVVSEVIEEKRIRPTVIRRRKKTVTVEAEKVPEKVEAAVAEAAPKAPAVEAPKPPVEARPAAAARAPAGKVRQQTKEAAFEEAIEEEPAEEARVEPVVETKEEMGVEMETAAAAEEAATVEPMKAEEAIETRKAQVLEKEKIKEKLRKPKKKKLDQPARIIRRAEESPLKPVLERKKEVVIPVKERVVAKPPTREPEAVIPEEEKERRGKKKKEKKGIAREEETPRSAIRLRKFEVFERADLYEGRMVKRKKKEVPGKEIPKRMKQPELVVPKPAKRKIKVPEKVTVADLAKAMSIKAAALIRKLLALGIVVNINQAIDYETASLLADDLGFELEEARFELEKSLEEVEDNLEELRARPPVVTIMGHVDHGKTSLLDYIRKSNIIAGESGGITQHIGAYYVERKGGDIVFLDTPGHEAFTAMRARGAKVTDIIVLVVAAEDGVMPQTKEAINHARAANIPIVVAINKIDKPEANVERVRRELAELGLAPEEWGGQTIFGSISAKTGQGVDELLELILLQAEVLELKANPEKAARGTVIEAKLDKTRGPVATVLIRSGTLKQGNFFVCGEHFGKVRAMLNNRGKRMIVATPSMPVEVYGISGVPMAGDKFIVVPDEKTAKEVIEYRLTQSKKWDGEKRGIVSLDDLFQKIKEGEVKELNLVLKADVQGSIEAISDSLTKLVTEEVKLKIIHSSTGGISETDVMLASASGAIIIGFNVRANPRVTELADKEKVDIRYFDVIYNLIQDIKLAMAGLLDPVYKENVIGRATVKELFHIPKVGAVAGCSVTDGHVERNARARLLRDEVVVSDGKIASLRRFKDDVKEV
ncbi:MAG: translation initiation factor IF-2, partial [Deltaproteobacteria bacterium]|nr:translation initiation factor IF-2 [Deltaproteobacteria bacterium]